MNYFWAFCVGGAICVAGQLLIDLTGLTPARILTGYVLGGQKSRSELKKNTREHCCFVRHPSPCFSTALR